MTQLTTADTSQAVRDETMWRAHLVFAQLMHCRAVARLPLADREELEAHCGCSLADSAETGQALLGLTRREVVALAEYIETPWDHSAIREAVNALRHEGIPVVDGRALREALLRRTRRELRERRG
jgi:hypothetical protein